VNYLKKLTIKKFLKKLYLLDKSMFKERYLTARFVPDFLKLINSELFFVLLIIIETNSLNKKIQLTILTFSFDILKILIEKNVIFV